MLRCSIVASALVFSSLSCAVATRLPILGVVDCTQKDYCRAVEGEAGTSWTSAHEDLYLQGTRAVLKEVACEQMPAMGRKLGYIAEFDLSVSCGSEAGQIPFAKTKDEGRKLFLEKGIGYVVEFRRVRAARVNDGIQVQISASYFGKPQKDGAQLELEGIDSYLLVRTRGIAEARLVSRLAI
jgi:hypothetical protein